MTQPTVAPGWHPVPDAPGSVRWWDGTQWTGALQTAAAVPHWSTSVAPKRTNHVLHLILTVLTVGLWSPVWISMTLLNKMSKEKTVTRYS